jgi:hypothetical protein
VVLPASALALLAWTAAEAVVAAALMALIWLIGEQSAGPVPSLR